MISRPVLRPRVAQPRLEWWRYVVGYVLTVAVVVFVAQALWQNRDIGWRVLRTSPSALTVVASVVVLSLAARALFLQRLVRELGAPVSIGECFLLFAMTNMVSMVTLPGAGVVYRASYLSRRHGIAVVPFAAGTAVFVMVGVLVWCLLGAAAFGVVALDTGGTLHALLGIAFGVAAGLALAAWGARSLSRLASLPMSRCDACWCSRFAARWFPVSVSTSVFLMAITVVLFCATVQLIGFFFVFRLVSVSVGPLETVAIVASHQLGGVVGLTPGALGVQEGLSVAVSTGLGVDAMHMLVATTLIRVGRLGTSLLIGIPCWYRLSKGTCTSCPTSQ